jgi:amino acid transporter
MVDAVTGGGDLRKNSVGASHIVFFVVAAAAPLTAVVGATPAAFAYGNGPGVPGTFLVVGALYLTFCVGFTAMNNFVRSAGGFYPYLANGLGRPLGVAGAMIAIATYAAINIAIYGLFGFFVGEIANSYAGLEISWSAAALVLLMAVYFCGSRNISFSGRILGLCMIAEIVLLGVLGTTILVHAGGDVLSSIAPFGPAAVFSSGFGISLVFVVSSFIGIEASVIFGEEAQDPARTIPRATSISVSLIATFYAFSTWAISIYYGPLSIASEAAKSTATLYSEAVHHLLGPGAAAAMNVLLVTSLFACALSFHNTINRYLFAMGRESIIWSGFARTNSGHQSPHVAGGIQTGAAALAIGAFALARLDPYTVVFAWSGTFASLGILILQTMVSLAVIGFFWNDARGVGAWARLAAPVVSAAGLAVCVALVVSNLALISGSDSVVVKSYPIVIAFIGVAGAAVALRIKSSRPAIYSNLGRAFN